MPTRDSFFATLDQHADTLEGDVKLPLVLLGNEGSGKSALLANWVEKRLEHQHRDEFLFQHYVGCSTQSLHLQQMLFRLETSLKNFFQLREMKVPDSEEELRWSLNRFLAAAAKKHNPARIIIIIDGINRLKNEGAPEGALHWLPTELPPCVRFIVSSVEFERVPPKGKSEIPHHRTYVELMRRQCPMLRIEPLSVNTRHHVINAFMQRNSDRLSLSENQQFKMVTAPATSQPMYLRSLLQGIRLAVTVTCMQVDQLLDFFLTCGTAHDLIDRNLNICCTAVFPKGDDAGSKNNSIENSIAESKGDNSEILGKIMSIIYASRNGLSEAEVWGVMKMVAGYEPDEEAAGKLMTILKDFTMVIDNMYSFSHEIYREVVYSKYIKSHDTLIRWHHLLARYFGRLDPCDRKLVALPYHLEVAGSWSKVKNCLTDINMFQLWWTPKFKKDFIKFWASLTKRTPLDPKKDEHHGKDETGKGASKKHKKSTNENAANEGHSNHHAANKPSYDVVEEYVKSLDEFRTLTHPSDETVANIILQIADFLLEFATLGHEADADVPPSIHPVIPARDLASIGVPHIVIDEDGRSTIAFPSIFSMLGTKNEENPDSKANESTSTKALTDIPFCTTYFFQRWLWIQFPYIALGNCEARYQAGCQKFIEASKYGGASDYYDDRRDRSSGKKPGSAEGGGSFTITKKSVKRTVAVREMSKSLGAEAFKLPEIKFHRKAARSVRRVNHDVVDEQAAAADKFTQRMTALQDDIQNYREEHDFVMQMKLGLNKRLAELKGALVEIERSAESMSQFDGELAEITRREKEAIEKDESVQVLHKNLVHLVVMCDRHPAKMPALIAELEAKLEQDVFLISEIKKRLWEQRAEKNTHVSNFRKMKQLVHEGATMHNKLLEYRLIMKQKLAQQQNEDQRKLALMHSSSGDVSSKKTTKKHSHHKGLGNESKDPAPVVLRGQSWAEMWATITSRTGITEPEIFFSRLENRSHLEEQINTLRKAAEQRLESLKKEVVETEAELEEVRYEASFAGGLSFKDQEKELAIKTQELHHTKDRSKASQLLVQEVNGGLAHIAEILGIQIEEDLGGIDILREIEAVLDQLMEEREKQTQAQNQTGIQGDSNSRMQNSVRDIAQTPETHYRSPELEVAVSKYENAKARLPVRLPSKPATSLASGSPRESESDDWDHEGEDIWDRTFVKSQSSKTLRIESRKGGTGTVLSSSTK